MTRRFAWPELAFWALALASLLLLPAQHLLLTEVAILALFALSLDLILGYAGVISLGHGAFFGLGAYVAGVTAVRLTAEPLSGLALAGLAAAALGAATAPLLVLRTHDLTRLMVTLGVAMLVGELAYRLTGLTGGSDGLQGILMDPLLGRWDFDLNGTTGYAYSLAVLLILFVFARWLTRSRFGLALRAIRDNPRRAAAIEVPVGARVVAVYTIAAGMAGIAGGLMAQTTMFVSLDAVALHRSAEGLMVLILGGTGWLYGGILGAVAFRLLQAWLAQLTPEYWPFWLGLILVAVVLVGRPRIAARLRGLAR